jgi:hypothetical protein
MHKLDRLGWAAGTTIVSYGVRVGVRADTEATLSRLEAAFPPEWKNSASPSVRRLYSVRSGARRSATTRSYSLAYSGIDRIARTLDFEEALAVFESDLRLYVAEHARHRVFVHAGVVGWRGRAILIPGRSHSGKSSLVRELVRAGGTYYSDEYAVIDSAGRVHPYPAALSLRPRRDAAGARIAAAELGAGTRPLPVGLVVVSRYQEAGRWRPSTLTAGQGVLELLANTVPARRRPAAVLETLSRVAATAPFLKGVRGEATETAGHLLSAVGSRHES